MSGFCGYVPPDKRQILSVKTTVSERMSLEKRALQAADAMQSRSFAQTPDFSVSRAATGGGAPATESFNKSYFLQKRHVGYTTYATASQSFVRSATDVPKRITERDFYSDQAEAPRFEFDGTTVTREATQSYAGGDDTAFFSRVRKVERNDDDARHSVEDPKTRSGAAKNLRCSAIQNKREQDPTFAPLPMHFQRVPLVRPNPLTAAGGASAPIGKACLQVAGSTQQLDFPDPRVVAEQARAVLAFKQGRTLLASDRALVEGASSKDLFAGTSKASEEVVSGFMGHVPANPSNVSKVKGASDQLRAHTKTFVTVTAPKGNSNTSLIRDKLRAAAEAAEKIGDYQPKTSTAFYQSQAARSDERAVNRVECGRKNAVRGFFSRGVGEQDDLVADQFCSRYRPLEGMMRHGAPGSHSWVSDVDLRRSPRM